MDSFLIGNIFIQWQCDGYRLLRGEFTEKFRYDGDWSGKTVILRGKMEPLEPYTHYPKLREEKLYDIYHVNGENLHLYNWAYLKIAYGVWPDRITEGRADVCSFDPAMNRQIPLDYDWFFGVCGLHKLFLRENSPVLHASYIDIGGQALLFTAPSETGKSTQAQLWCDYAGAELINGDRVLLGEKDGVWHAYGYPNCGSSQVCVNRTLPIRAIAVLRQGSENRVERLSPAEQIRSLASGMAVYSWDAGEISQALTIASRICGGVPVIRLVCRPDEDAVNVLKSYLEEVPL